MDADARDKSIPRGLDISIKFTNNFIRSLDSLKRALDEVKQKYREQDAEVNFGIGHVEDKKLTHGISLGALNNGIYGGTDLLYNPKIKEYVVKTRMNGIVRFDWTGTKQGTVVPPTRFSKFTYIARTGSYIAYNPGKSLFYMLSEEFALLLDSVCQDPVDMVIPGEKGTEENTVEFFIMGGFTLYRYSYNPVNNVVTMLENMKLSDVEAENATVEQMCFDRPSEDKKQWVYLTFKQHCTVIDVTGRIYGTKKNLHPTKITSIGALGASEFVVTGDEKGLLKLWGQRWAFITELKGHTVAISHIIEHPNGRGVVSLSADMTMFAWNVDSKKKVESIKLPEAADFLTINQERKSFMTLGSRKLALWIMDVLYFPLVELDCSIMFAERTWNPDYPTRAIVPSKDNAIRIINPSTGYILTTALINPTNRKFTEVVFVPTNGLMFVLLPSTDPRIKEEIQLFDVNQNPCKLKETWDETIWESNPITTFALYEHIPALQLYESSMNAYDDKKRSTPQGIMSTFLIAGRMDGSLSRLGIAGKIDFTIPCHKGQVNKIEISPETKQFVSLGIEPSVRLWKIDIYGPDIFIPLFDLSWNYPIREVALLREVISIALSHQDSDSHKLVMFNLLETERYDHKASYKHQKRIVSLSSSPELMLFCSASLDETLRLWTSRCDLVRVLCLNWVPIWAGFGTPQGDIFLAIQQGLQIIPANKHLNIVYRNRCMRSEFTSGLKEMPVPLNAARAGQDPRLFVAQEQEEMIERETKEKEREKEAKKKKRWQISEAEKAEAEIDKSIKIPTVQTYTEPKDTQRAKTFDKFRAIEEDLKMIVEGNHPIDPNVPDFRKMNKKQLDEYAKSVFPQEEDKRKLFVSESRLACLLDMYKNSKNTDFLEPAPMVDQPAPQ